MSKLGEIPLIPSIRGKREFRFSRDEMLDDEGDWRKPLDDFVALLKYFSVNKQFLLINLWMADDMDFNKFIVRVEWGPDV